jgi:hypothetical protein
VNPAHRWNIRRRYQQFRSFVPLPFGTLRRVGRVTGPILLGAWKTVFSAAILIAALSFIQRQEPYVAMRIDPKERILSLSNVSLVPISTMVYAVSFEVNLQESLPDSLKITNTQITGTVMSEKTLWFGRKRSHDLKKDQRFSFLSDLAFPNAPLAVYCFVLEERNLLSNQNKVEFMTISNDPMDSFHGITEGSFGEFGFLLKWEENTQDLCHSLYAFRYRAR